VGEAVPVASQRPPGTPAAAAEAERAAELERQLATGLVSIRQQAAAGDATAQYALGCCLQVRARCFVHHRVLHSDEVLNRSAAAASMASAARSSTCRCGP
jgi:hypothetical protein